MTNKKKLQDIEIEHNIEFRVIGLSNGNLVLELIKGEQVPPGWMQTEVINTVTVGKIKKGTKVQGYLYSL